MNDDVADFELALTCLSGGRLDELQELLCGHPGLVKMRDPEGRTLLLNECMPILRVASADAVTLLLAAGSDASVQDLRGNGCLHGLAAMHSEEYEQPVELVGRLVAAGADIDARDVFGKTALHVAIYEARPGVSWRIVDALIDAGADIRAMNKFGVTPLSLADQIAGSESLALHLRSRGG